VKIPAAFKNGPLVLLSLISLGIAVLLIANSWDESLAPEAGALLREPDATVAGDANGYYVLLGMYAPMQDNALVAGKLVQDTYERLYREDRLRQDYPSPRPPSQAATAETRDFSKLRCPLQGRNCVAHYGENEAQFRALIQANQVLLGRYAQMMQLSGYQERPVPSPYAPFAPYNLLARAAELQTAAGVLDVKDGRDQEGLATLAGAIAFHRRLLAGSTVLISRMMEVLIVRREIQALSELIESKPALTQTHWDLIKPLVVPLTERENDMQPPILLEAHLSAMLLAQMPQLLKRGTAPEVDITNGMERIWGARFFYLPNATTNMVPPFWNALAELGHGNVAGYEQRKQQFDLTVPGHQSKSYAINWTFVRNPVGKALFGLTLPRMTTYIERLYDLDGYIRLVNLQANLRHDQVARDAIAAYVANAPPEMRNPYNGEAMQWDAAAGSLAFTGKQASNGNLDQEPKVFRVKLAVP
jgi:hypothetical protein